MHVTRKYTCVRINEISCMSNGDDALSRLHPGGPVSDELVAMMESPQITTWPLAEPAERRTRSHERGSTAELLPP